MTLSRQSGKTLSKVWRVLDGGQQRSALALALLMLVGMLLETLGIGLVIPVLGLITQSDLAQRYPSAEPLLTALGYPDRQRVAVAGMIILVAVAVLKALYLGFLTWVQARFVCGVQVNLAHRLFGGYLRQPYSFHLNHNSAHLILTVANETGVFAQTAITAWLLLLTELQVLIGISVLLLFVEPLGAVAVGLLIGLAVFGFSGYTRERVARWGKHRQQHDGFRFQHLQQGLGGAKDAKLLGREDDFLAQYVVHSVGSARAGEKQMMLQQLPKLWLEFLAVLALASLVVVMVLRGRPMDAVVPTVGVFGAAAFRLIPSANRVLGAIQNIRFSRAAVEKLFEETRLVESTPVPTRGKPLPFERLIELREVSFRYPGADVEALSDVSLCIDRGTSVGFVGTSGAGKSTLVDVVLGLLTPIAGSVVVDGVDIETNIRGWQDQIGYVPQSIFLTDDSLRRNIAFGLPDENIDDASVRAAIRAAQLDEFVEALPDGLDTVVGERGVRISGGQRQRIGIARALYHDPQVLVLDEATSSLDEETERGVMEAVRAIEGSKTVLIVTHRLSTVDHCRHLFRLESGRLVVTETHAG